MAHGDEFRPPNDNQNPFGDQKNSSQFDDPFVDPGPQDIWSKLAGDTNGSHLKRRVMLYGGLLVALLIGAGGYIYSEDPTFLGLLNSESTAEFPEDLSHPKGPAAKSDKETTTDTQEMHEEMHAEEIPAADKQEEHHDAPPVQQITTKPAPQAEPQPKEIVVPEKHHAHKEQEIPMPTSEPIITGKPVLRYPEDGAKRYFDDTAGNPTFVWDGESPATIEFSQNPNMQPTLIKETVNGNTYELPIQWLGKGYGRVTNSQGVSPIFTFITKPAKPITLGLIDANGKLLRNGAEIPADGSIKWMHKAQDKISRFKLQVSSHKDKWEEQDLITPPSTDTSGSEVQLEGNVHGEYWVRVLGHSEASTLWEATKPIRIVIK